MMLKDVTEFDLDLKRFDPSTKDLGIKTCQHLPLNGHLTKSQKFGLSKVSQERVHVIEEKWKKTF